MAFVIADRVRETSTTIGAGNFTLAGAVTGYQTFDAALDTGDTTYYTIADQSGANWEVGIGTFTSPSTLARTTILSSSNGGSVVTFGAGTKDVFISLPASKTNTVEAGNLAFTGTAQRITGDFSNGTIANRVMFQTNTTNGSTGVIALPNGTGTSSTFIVTNSSDVANTSFGQINISTSLGFQLQSSVTGTGTNLPMTFFTAGSERMRLDTSGNMGIGTSSPSQKLEVFASANSLQIESIVRNDQPGTGVAAIGFNVSSSAAAETTSTKAGIGLVRSNAYGVGSLCFYNNGTTSAGDFTTSDERMRIDSSGNIIAGASAALATTATNGFLYVPTCAGTPTGTPTAVTGMAPIVVNTTNNKLYFYSGGAWRDAGP